MSLNKSIFRIPLDLHNNKSTPEIVIQQTDANVRRIQFVLTDGGKPYTLPTENASAYFKTVVPTATPTKIFLPCTIDSKGNPYWDITNAITGVVCTLDCQLELYGQTVTSTTDTVSELIASPHFNITVEEAINVDGAVAETQEYTNLTTAITQANTLNVTATKSGDTATVTVTKSGTTQTVTITDGAAGTSAGFGTPTATIDGTTGTPSVDITASGSDTEKVFSFAFHNLKGEKGDSGSSGNTSYITISRDGTGSQSGTITESQLETLNASNTNYILFGGVIRCNYAVTLSDTNLRYYGIGYPSNTTTCIEVRISVNSSTGYYTIVEETVSGGGMTNPMTEKGDLIIGGSLGSPTRLALGTEGQVLTSDGSGDMSWQDAGGGDDVSFGSNNDIVVTDGTNTAVEANPSGTATQTLSSLKVGNTIYSAGGGGSSLYQHAIIIRNGALTCFVTFLIVNDTSTPFTLESLKTYLSSTKYDPSVYGGHPCSGTVYGANSSYPIATAINYDTDYAGFRVRAYTSDGSSQINVTLTSTYAAVALDTITQIS